MKKRIIAIITALTVIAAHCYALAETTDYVRLHIRANSDSEYDVTVKTLVAEKVNEYLVSSLSGLNGYEECVAQIIESRGDVEKIIDEYLLSLNVDYSSSVMVKTEYFPTRSYGGKVLKSGEYVGLIVDLGRGSGDNWWCVVYPPMCYLNGKKTDGKKVVYKSKIKEKLDEISKGKQTRRKG